MNYVPTIGLEIHAELKTQTKMFCDSLNDPNETEPNKNVCPICLGHPGALPVLNKKAVEAMILIGMALHGDTPQHSKFDRKNYFYPDLPKGYQISQYDLPLVFGGVLKGVQLTRVHLEEDTGRLIHSDDGKHTLVDFNRAGVPLMELVSEPDVTSAEQAVEFAKELQLILRYLNVSDAHMDKGQMRVEANVSVRKGVREKDGKKSPLGTKVEVKNINSFRAVHDAILYEIKRQTELLEDGGTVIQETRGWDEKNLRTVSQRLKEEAHDYRYFPEPDLPPLDLSKFNFSEIKKRLPELPQEKRIRFADEYNLKTDQIETLVSDKYTAQFFEETLSELSSEDKIRMQEELQLMVNYLTSDLRGLAVNAGVSINKTKITPENFADLIELIAAGKISSRTAKDMLKIMFETGTDPKELLQKENLEQVSDEGELMIIAKRIVQANPQAVTDYKNGKGNALQFLIGRAMGELKGKGNPHVLQKIFKEVLE